jgi:tight adherence protein B
MILPGPLGLVLGALLLGSGLLLAARTSFRPSTAPRLGPRTDPAAVPRTGSWLSGPAAAADRLLDRMGRRDAFAATLEQAAVGRPAGEVLVLAGVALVPALVLGGLLGGPAVGILFAGGLAGAGIALLRIRRDQRRQRFGEQLPDLLQLLAGNLRVGYGLLQALETAAQEVERPTRDELQRATSEVRLGRDLVEALHAIAERQGNEDFEWVVQAIGINRDVGGDLAEVLDAVAETIRARAHLARQVSALSAEGRISAYVLLALPIGIAAFSALTNPSYIGLLFTTGTGLAMVAMSAALMAVGCAWLRVLVRANY